METARYDLCDCTFEGKCQGCRPCTYCKQRISLARINKHELWCLKDRIKGELIQKTKKARRYEIHLYEPIDANTDPNESVDTTDLIDAITELADAEEVEDEWLVDDDDLDLDDPNFVHLLD